METVRFMAMCAGFLFINISRCLYVGNNIVHTVRCNMSLYSIDIDMAAEYNEKRRWRDELHTAEKVA